MIFFSDIHHVTRVRHSTLHYVTTRGLNVEEVRYAGQRRRYDLDVAVTVAITAMLADAGSKMAVAVRVGGYARTLMNGFNTTAAYVGKTEELEANLATDGYQVGGSWRITVADQQCFCVHHLKDDRSLETLPWYSLSNGQKTDSPADVRSKITLEIGKVIRELTALADGTNARAEE